MAKDIPMTVVAWYCWFANICISVICYAFCLL